MRSRKHLQTSEPVAVGVAWFDREQWERLYEVVADRAKLDGTFEEWEANARHALANLRARGVDAAPFHVNVAELVQWCAERNLAIDGAARAQYVSFMLRRGRGEA
jgi:hypothetical protein